MPKFFIEHPVFAWVVAILISLAGVISILGLGVESYPSIAPPQVTVSATYPGASADTTEKSVTQVIEQQLTGIDHLLYFSSSSASNGRATITLTFETGTDADIAQVQVQNKVSLATPRLPTEVTQQGVVVAKANAGFLMVVALQSDSEAITRDALNDIVGSRVLDQISRIPGVGSTQQFGSEYAMNIWLNPERMQGYNLSATQVLAAIKAQNVQFAAGSLGADPSPAGHYFTATVSAEGRFSSPDQFENIILRANADGSRVLLKDVARIAFGANNYGFDTQYNGKPTGAFAIQLLPGANALNVANAVTAKMDELESTFPTGVTWFSPYDSTTFVKISIEEVVKTLIEAIVLVFLVMLIFLQNFRATLIPTLVIPVALLGTFLGMSIIGFTINQLTLFAMVLAIGIVVDDAIVVIENVERIMTEEKLPPKAATQKAMTQITGAVVAITVVLAAVFIPSALQGGAAGEIYKQFALTIAIAMAFSAFLALGFTPALCATFLKATHGEPNVVYRTFNKYYDKVSGTYVGHITSAVKHAPRWMILFVVLTVLCGFLFTRMPGSFLPEEDQGYALAIVQLPPGSTKAQTNATFAQMRGILEKQDGFEGMLQVAGFSFVGSGENVGMGFIRLKPWADRDITVPEFIQNMNGAFYGIKEAQIFVVNLPTVQGLGQFGGFDMWLQDRGGAGFEQLTQARNILLGKAAEEKELLTGVRPNGLENAPQLQLHVDRVQAQTMGLSVSDVYSTIQLMLAPVYVNDFFYQGRIKRVTMQADGPFRTGAESLNSFYTPSSLQTNADGTPAMIPLSTVVKSEWVSAPPSLSRYNGYSAINIVGSQAPGKSSGEAMQAMERIVQDDLPAGFGYDWSGMSYQEILAGNAATLLLVLSIVVVFLCLAALYESWSIPVAVLLVVPLGVLGALSFSLARGLPNDLYFKIGLITVIGLAAKNAILIVEFAVEQRAAGKNLREATIEASRLRFRPILMTSFAFIMGVIPMAISTGAGANARHAIGTGVIGGMVFATFLGLLMIPVFFVVVRRMLGDKLDEPSKEFLERQGEATAAHRPDR
ncbi:MAG: multidrug transporter [Stenotrophomonas rhizophila]|jgi:multidrug efflux pump|uniref:multidrug efflux RND transporter permease subunit n=1 Tax=Stenotrophomonas TaxID=40323 RepID=UPI00081D1F6B|nr:MULTISPECIES: multidrug efflux RND transporter permease subunit [Stenotrophomonas]HBZ45759.1 hydrophobe/amphiphile efflux-1 family RND transporter [Stenotrophomonas sp.]AOA72789.1 multidrug transporter [Stenotrophomonas rhizophila]MDF2818864.1 multidrug transporter [Stenotrophomonas rhizophila]MDQ1062255.1 multidrug efflux pump [Stenotrophomonas sp. SORGH_AS_0282]MDQ1189389.1 multidrug efflux pump [Stenotrophomonas sp. SORGH_AS_0282]